METIGIIKELVLTATGVITVIVLIRKEIRESRDESEARKAKRARDD